MRKELTEIIDFINDEEIELLSEKVNLNGFVSTFEVPFAESLQNLKYCRGIVHAWIEKGMLEQTPLTVQKRLHDIFSSIKSNLENLLVESDYLTSFCTNIETLFTLVWEQRLHFISAEELRYTVLENEQKRRNAILDEQARVLSELLASKPRVDDLIANSLNLTTKLNSTVENSTTIIEQAKATYEEIIDVKSASEAHLDSIQKTNINATENLGKIESKLQSATRYDEQMSTFYETVETFRQTIETTSTKSRETITENQDKYAALLSQVSDYFVNIRQNSKDQQFQIDDLIRKATGASLFHAFENRKNELVKGKSYWRWATVGSVGLFVLLGVAMIIEVYKVGELSWPFLALRAMIAFPLGFLVYFCSSQYTKERWLEEQYAFKSNISLSLEPFENFVGRMTAKEQEAELKKHREFVVSLIYKIFAEPEEHSGTIAHDIGIGHTTESIEKVMKALKPLLDATKHLRG